MTSVVFAPTLAAARRAGGNRTGLLFGSPRSDAALDRALALGARVRFCAPAGDAAFWALVRRRYALPAAPALLRDAIGGIARRHETEETPRLGRGRSGGGARLRALWLEGPLTDRRARSLLREGGDTRLWVIPDFRKLRVSAPLQRRMERAGVRVAALRPLRASVLRFRR